MTRTIPKKAFDQIVKTIGDPLQLLGFTLHGTVLRLLAQGNCGVIEFQRSAKSSGDKLLFTVNVGVVCGDILDSEAPLQDLRKGRFIHAHIRQRIGAFLPDRPDKWWQITEAADPDALAREISDLILEKVVPYIQRYLSTDSIISMWESGQSPGLTDGRRADLLGVLTAKRQGGAA